MVYDTTALYHCALEGPWRVVSLKFTSCQNVCAEVSGLEHFVAWTYLTVLTHYQHTDEQLEIYFLLSLTGLIQQINKRCSTHKEKITREMGNKFVICLYLKIINLLNYKKIINLF